MMKICRSVDSVKLVDALRSVVEVSAVAVAVDVEEVVGEVLGGTTQLSTMNMLLSAQNPQMMTDCDIRVNNCSLLVHSMHITLCR